MEKAYQTANEPLPSIEPSITSLTEVQLRTRSTDELVRLLTSQELMQPVNAAVRQRVIALLQEREGNEFVGKVLGIPPGQPVT